MPLASGRKGETMRQLARIGCILGAGMVTTSAVIAAQAMSQAWAVNNPLIFYAALVAAATLGTLLGDRLAHRLLGRGL